MKLIEGIKQHSANSKLALLLRHGDREQIPQGEFGNEIMLNEKGRERSLSFGEALKEFSVNRIFTSPIPRCVQTAKLIAKGFGRELEIIQTKSLGDPGLHTADEKIAGEFYLTHGFHEILRRFMRDESVPGVPDKKHFTNIMTEFLHQSAEENGLTVFITHDSLIAMYRFCMDGTVYTVDNWVDYLEGFVYKIEEQKK
jgi:broad specificity phosphatase PhoE